MGDIGQGVPKMPATVGIPFLRVRGRQWRNRGHVEGVV